MQIGDALPTRTVVANASAMAVLAAILQDPNPIHLDPSATVAAGLGDRVINQGPANLAYVLDMAAGAFPSHRIADIDCHYVGNVRDGDRVTAGGVIVAIAEGEITADCWLRLDDGQSAVTVRLVMAPR